MGFYSKNMSSDTYDLTSSILHHLPFQDFRPHMNFERNDTTEHVGMYAYTMETIWIQYAYMCMHMHTYGCKYE